MMQLREACPDDICQIADVIASAFCDVAERFGFTAVTLPSHPAFTTDLAISRTIERGTIFLLPESKDRNARELRGCVGIRSPHNSICALEKLAVLPAYRHLGLGSKLIEEAIRFSKRLGAKRLEAAIVAEHANLKRRYEGQGFIWQRTEYFPHLPFLVDFLYLETELQSRRQIIVDGDSYE